MQRNMKHWLAELLQAPAKAPMPLLSFPAMQKLGISVNQLISSSDYQAQCMKLVADCTDSAAAVSLMDLSVEAECFGATISVSEDEVPTVSGRLIHSMEEAEALSVPPVGSARTGIYLEAIRKATELITDRPVFAGVIGPYSLAARLLDVTEIMMDCYDEPEMVHLVLEKVTDFLCSYCMAYKQAGANGVVIAEPVTGLLSPDLAEEFSGPYVRKLVERVQDENFLVIYHNCGNYVLQMMDSILATGSAAYHFGNAIDMKKALAMVPADTVVMGNVDPAGQFRHGTPDSVRAATIAVLEACAAHPNFVISSGCDIPPMSPWENIDAFFAAVKEFYEQ